MISTALIVVGVGLVLAGVAHVGLPRALGWTSDTHRAAGPLGALVVGLHVHFVGLFLVAFGVLAVVVARTPPSPVGTTFCVLAAVVFAVRAVAEVVLVGRALAQGPRLFAVLHRGALLIWPMLAAVFVLGALR